MAHAVGFERQDGVAILAMDDGKANALSLEMIRNINESLDRAASGSRAVVLRGRPGVLCGGFDLKIIRGGDAAARTAMSEAGMRLLERLYLYPLPVIIACTGHAVAAGGLLLLSADVRIGVRGAFRIGLNETAIGLALPQTGIELARDRLSSAALSAATLGARLFDPDEAVTAGYLDAAVDADDFDATVARSAHAYAQLDPTAFATTKRRLRQPTLDRLAGS